MPTLDWIDREGALRVAESIPYRLLESIATYGDTSANNLLIQGDNLDALKALLPLYRGRVKCIFIDPPYNTGSAFEHYDDNVEHSQWLSLIYPRLLLLRDLLANDGTIWATIDDNEGHYLKVLMDEVFGRRNFVTTVIWEKADSPRNSARQFSADHDYMHVYARNPEWTPIKLPRTEEANSIYTNPDNDERGPWIPGDPYANKPYSKGQYTILGPTGREFSPPPGRFWRISEDRLRQLDAEGRIWWGPKGEARPSIKRYLSEVSDLVPRTIWSKDAVGSNRTSKNEMRALFPGEESFGTPKPERLVERVLRIATREGDIVLDSFLGSGTTAAVAHKMNRQWIGIEMGEHVETHCLPRLKKVVQGEGGGISSAVGWQGGGGFNFMRLGPAVFDEYGAINPKVRFKTLAGFVWLQETGVPADRPFSSPLLGVNKGTAYFLLFNGILGDKRVNGGNVLTSSVLESLCRLAKGEDVSFVVYGESCRLGPARLKESRVVFKQIPYDVRAR